MSSVIILDSSDDETPPELKSSRVSPHSTPSPTASASPPVLRAATPIPPKNDLPLNSNIPKSKSNDENEPPRKRIKPTLISATIDKSKYDSGSPTFPLTNDDEAAAIVPSENENDSKDKHEETNKNGEDNPTDETTDNVDPMETPMTVSFLALIDVCKKADPSGDMKTLIEKKLLKYYHSAHPDFVASKGFRKTVNNICEQIEAKPELVYYQLKAVVEELKVRRRSKAAVMSNEEVSSTGNERKDRQIKLLSSGLLGLTKRITNLEEADVDLNDEDNSAYLQLERLKKHACKIYDKICDLTGESKHAHRTVKKPITFQGTVYPQFNKTLQAFVNRTHMFPDFFDVLRCLEHCNVQYGFGLRNDDMKKIAQDAFLKIGKLLQNRRKADLYETVSHFTGTLPDPALKDETLSEKLSENEKFHAKISSIIDRYAKEQEISSYESKGPTLNKDCTEKETNEKDIPSPASKDESSLSINNTSDKENKTTNEVRQSSPIVFSVDEEIVISDEDDS